MYQNYAELASQALHDPQLAIEQWKQALILTRGDLDYPQQMAEYLTDAQRLQEAKGIMSFAEEMEPELRESEKWRSLHEKVTQTSREAQSATTK